MVKGKGNASDGQEKTVRRSNRSSSNPYSSAPTNVASPSPDPSNDHDPDGIEEVPPDSDEESDDDAGEESPKGQKNLRKSKSVSDATESEEEEPPERTANKTKSTKPGRKGLIVTQTNQSAGKKKKSATTTKPKKPRPAERSVPVDQDSPLRSGISDPARANKEQARVDNVESMKGSAAATKKKVAELEERVTQIQKEARDKLEKQREQIRKKDHDLAKLKEINQQLEDDVEEIQHSMTQPRAAYDKGSKQYMAIVKQIKDTVKDKFGELKFVNNDDQAFEYGNIIMDNLGWDCLIHDDKDDAVATAKVNKERENFRAEFEGTYLSALNSQRSDAQSAMKDVLITYMDNSAQLPEIKWMEYILQRDHSAFDEEEGDSEATVQKKKDDYAKFLTFYDLFVDKMLPTTAGAKKWNVKNRHFQPLSTCKLPDGRLRVHASSEALVALFYANNRTKWMAQKKFMIENPNKKDSTRWDKKKPDDNLEYKTPYSDATMGQCKFGGWTKEGRKLYGRYGIMVKRARSEKQEQGLKYETECFQRLYEANKEMHEKKKKTKKRKYQADEEEDEEDEELDWV